jgi:hypothetical protein
MDTLKYDKQANDLYRSSSMTAFNPIKSRERAKFSPYDNVSKENLNDIENLRANRTRNVSSFVDEPLRTEQNKAILRSASQNGESVVEAPSSLSKKNSYYDLPSQISNARITLTKPLEISSKSEVDPIVDAKLPSKKINTQETVKKEEKFASSRPSSVIERMGSADQSRSCENLLFDTQHKG